MSNIGSMILAYLNDYQGGYWLLRRSPEDARRIIVEDVILYHNPSIYDDASASKIKRYEERLMELIEDGTVRETQLSDRETEYEVL